MNNHPHATDTTATKLNVFLLIYFKPKKFAHIPN